MEREFLFETKKPRLFNVFAMIFLFGMLLLLLATASFQYFSGMYRRGKEENLELAEKWSGESYYFLFDPGAQFERIAKQYEEKERSCYYLAVLSAGGALIALVCSFLPMIIYAVIRLFGKKYSAEIVQDSYISGDLSFRNGGVEFPLSMRAYIDGEEMTVYALRRKTRSSAERKVGTTVQISKIGPRVVVCD